MLARNWLLWRLASVRAALLLRSSATRRLTSSAAARGADTAAASSASAVLKGSSVALQINVSAPTTRAPLTSGKAITGPASDAGAQPTTVSAQISASRLL